MNKAIFLDRDGTVNVDYGYTYQVNDLEFLPGVVDALQIFLRLGYLLIVVTNQSGVGRGYYTLDDVSAFHNCMQEKLKLRGIVIHDFLVCPHTPEDECLCRKPSPLLIEKAKEKYNIDSSQSYMFGDKESDVKCGLYSSMKSFLVTPEHTLLYWANQLLNYGL